MCETDSPARESAYDRLDEALTLALRQDEPEVRIEIAHVLGRPALGSRAQRLFRRLLQDPDAELTAEELVAWRAEIERRLAASGGMLLVEEALRPGYRGLDMSGDTSNPGGHLGTVQKIEQLGRVDLFSGLGAQELLVLAERSEEVVFQPGQTIFREGAAAAEIYSIIAGRVELCREAGQIELLGPGESFGTLAALTREPRFFTACALERSHCLKLHRDTFWEILEAYPRVAHGVIETLGSEGGGPHSPGSSDEAEPPVAGGVTSPALGGSGPGRRRGPATRSGPR